jgi:hypothetical protein
MKTDRLITALHNAPSSFEKALSDSWKKRKQYATFPGVSREHKECWDERKKRVAKTFLVSGKVS